MQRGRFVVDETKQNFVNIHQTRLQTPELKCVLLQVLLFEYCSSAMPINLLVKRRWSDLTFLIKVREQGDQTHDVYSKIGLTYVVNARERVSGSRDRNHVIIKLLRARDFTTILLIWTLNLSLMSNINRRSLTAVTTFGRGTL